MHCQTLDADELLNLRWAYDDPNPAARVPLAFPYRVSIQVKHELNSLGCDA
jgi:hypothetical protein